MRGTLQNEIWRHPYNTKHSFERIDCFSVKTSPWFALTKVSLAYGAFGQKGLVCLLDLGYPEGLKDITDMVGLGGLVSVVCLVSKPNFVSKRLFATIYTIHTSGDVIYEHSRIWPASVSTIHVCQFITNSNARIKTCLTWPTNSCCTLLDKFAK